MEPLTKRSQGEALLSAAPLAPREKSEIFPAGTPYEIAECRTEGPAIAALRANRVAPKVSPEMVGPLLRGNDRGPRRKNVQTRAYPSELNICAPMPRERGPRLDPVPVGFNTFLFRIR